MTNIDNYNDNFNRIYTDFVSHEFGNLPSVRQLFQGEPFIQIEAATAKIDFRPRILDLLSKKWFLIDTGAAVSVYPKSMCPFAKQNEQIALRAINGEKINFR